MSDFAARVQIESLLARIAELEGTLANAMTVLEQRNAELAALKDGMESLARIAELEAENERLQIAYDVQKAATCQFVIVSAEDGPKAVDEGMAKAYQVASEQKSRANDAEAELAALNRMLYWVWVQHFGNVTFEDWLADLRTRAEEGGEDE